MGPLGSRKVFSTLSLSWNWGLEKVSDFLKVIKLEVPAQGPFRLALPYLPWSLPQATLLWITVKEMETRRQVEWHGDCSPWGITHYLYFSQFSCSVMSHSLQPHGLQHARLPCPSPTPRACPNSCPLNWWCHPTISSSVIPFSSCLQSFPASGSFPMSQLFASGDQSFGASASASALPTGV